MPWPGRIAAWTSPGEDGFTLATTLGRPARMGRLVSPLYAGPTSRFDLGNVAIVDLAYRHARQRHRPRALRRRQRAGGRGRARRLGGAAGRRRRADRARALPAVAAAARPARHRGRDRQPGAGRRAGRRARRGAGAAAGRRRRRSGSRPTGASGRRRSRSPTAPTGSSASRPRASACGRSRSAMSGSRGARRASPAISSIAWTRRSRALAADSWTAAEVPLAEEREAYEVEILDGATVVRTLAATTTSVTYTAAQQLADWGALLGPGDTLGHPHLPALRPRRAGRAGLRHPRVLIPCPTPAPISCCRICSRRRRRSTSPSTRRCGCSTASCSSPCSTGT